MNPQQPVSFPGWKAALASSNLSPVVKSSHTRAILTFLHHCKKSHSPVSVMLIRQWLDGHEAADDGPAHVALRWFYRSAPKESESAAVVPQQERAISEESVLGTSRSTFKAGSYHQRPPWRPMEPRPASQDLGGPDWEQALVATLRMRGMLSRTEDTYRAWGKRFAGFIAPKSPYAASGEEVGAFLTHLAVHNRASPSNQRQALNALVFLMEKSLGRELGAMDFRVYGFADAVA